MSESESNSLAHRVATLEAREAIKELKTQYARRSDAVFNDPGNASAVALADIFTDDGVLDLGPYGSFSGRTELLDAFENLLPQGTAWTTHYIVNPVICVNGDEAEGSWYYLIQSLPAGEGATLLQLFGGYQDKYVKTNEGWKIKETITSFFTPPA
ncbi:nuclear transport factor 2 family protein [Pseudenhygromyxa sp. WMMC2535]|uniref:nuclear transport factor 2 family protein n=1 Tax=Pseudenhygromyxa sp. WMMC2535 TaxID=2712867 RepID=UPI001554320E|nr:nuclear transport factor 2 family protein [Pseudenhygromyxa sp. WMMC2535]NVB42143.1 nuclear transport factor 2 family protein [Pseudenhygromyxa sp. WMMC2535]